MIKCNCRGYHNWITFSEKVICLKVQVKSYKEERRGEITGWILTIDNDNFAGSCKQDLFEKLRNISNKTKEKIQMVWTDNLPLLYGFFQSYATDFFPPFREELINPNFIYLQLFKKLEFRDINLWNKEVAKYPIDKWGPAIQDLYQNVFIPDRYFYVTPVQIVRKELARSYKGDLVKEIYPKNFAAFRRLREALFGGLCYCGAPRVHFNTPHLLVDITSAYIFAFFARPHVISAAKAVNPSTWQKYINNEEYGSLGLYKITFTTKSTKIKCYKNAKGYHIIHDKLKPQTQAICMNNIDLKLFLEQINVIGDVECLILDEFKLGRLPKEIVDILVGEYIKKEESPKDSEERRLQKIKLLSIPGDSIRRAESNKEYKEHRLNATLAPQWGVWTNSYCRELLFKLGNSLEPNTWKYSDTDSLICNDTPHNRAMVEIVNSWVREQVKEACEYYDIQFEKIPKLGQFKEEANIVELRALATKEYMYTTDEGKFVVKAAGCDKEYLKSIDDLYTKDKIPTGDRLMWNIENDSYFEWYLDEKYVEDFMEVELLLLNYLRSL